MCRLSMGAQNYGMSLKEEFIMKILVKLFATLREGRGKQLNIEVTDGSTLEEAMGKIGLKKEEVSLMLINGKNERSFDIILSDSDIVSLFPPVGGG